MTTAKTTVVLLFGGRSSEHSISCATAGSVLTHIDRDRFDVVPVGITKSGAFTLQPDDASTLALGDMPVVADNGTRVALPLEAGSNQLTVTDSSGTRTIAADVVFPILHGPFGEDGTVQGIIELSGMPYVGNGVLASAVGMDKHFTKTVLEHAGIQVAPWVTVTRRQWDADPEGVRTSLGDLTAPLFVKPARAGSSVGVSRIDSLMELDRAMSVALAEDSRVLIEAGVVGREIEVGVLGGRDGGIARASLPGEIVIDNGGFYDFEAKYLGTDGITTECPASLDEATTHALQSTAVRAFAAIAGAGLARVDFFVSPDHGIVVNEINTMPGFTAISMFPVVWGESGIDYAALITELIELGLAEER